jgi:hypothetical protein
MPISPQEVRQSREYLRLANAALRTLDSQVEAHQRILRRLLARKAKQLQAADADKIIAQDAKLNSAFNNWEHAASNFVSYLRA